MSKRVLIPVADGTEDIELVSITDILRRGDLKVTVASIMAGKNVALAHGLNIVADSLITDVSAKDFDAVLLPGGFAGSEAFGKSAVLGKFMHELKADGKLYGAMCAAPVLSLGPLGLLSDVATATCYPTMESKFPVTVKPSFDAVVRSGQCLTSRGPGTAMFFALAAVGILRSREVAKQLSKDLLLDHCPEVEQLLNL